MPRLTIFKGQRFGGKATGHSSTFEVNIQKHLTSIGGVFKYEPKSHVVAYTDPMPHKYTPDFVLENGIIIEAKGYFDNLDRRKHLIIKRSRPELDIRFVFSRSKTRISKASKTTYGMWCEKNGFLYADKLIPESWLKEKPSK